MGAVASASAADPTSGLGSLVRHVRRELDRLEAVVAETPSACAEASDIGHLPVRSGVPAAGGRMVSDPTAQVALSPYHAGVRRALRRLERAVRRAHRDLEAALLELEGAVRGEETPVGGTRVLASVAAKRAAGVSPAGRVAGPARTLAGDGGASGPEDPGLGLGVPLRGALGAEGRP